VRLSDDLCVVVDVEGVGVGVAGEGPEVDHRAVSPQEGMSSVLRRRQPEVSDDVAVIVDTVGEAARAEAAEIDDGDGGLPRRWPDGRAENDRADEQRDPAAAVCRM
jgi:hypothetical protein